jgi:hypothetical protein
MHCMRRIVDMTDVKKPASDRVRYRLAAEDLLLRKVGRLSDLRPVVEILFHRIEFIAHRR